MNQKIILVFALLFASLITWQCTPKTTEAAKSSETVTQVKPPKPKISKDPCAKFSDSKKGESALDAHVIYRDLIKAKRYEQAMPYWRSAFAAAPAADGKRKTHFEDGIKNMMPVHGTNSLKIMLNPASSIFLHIRLSKI